MTPLFDESLAGRVHRWCWETECFVGVAYDLLEDEYPCPFVGDDALGFHDGHQRPYAGCDPETYEQRLQEWREETA
jgi:hypothetical protein